ncbi:MAG: cold-shock protein [Haliea sp.]|nr:cold-shock protein [Haliea sp.]
MGLFAKLLLSLIVATIASTLTSVLLSGELFDLRLLLAFFLATASTALIVRNSQVSTHPQSETFAQPPSTQHGIRERGTVKWFNSSKGFGFIVRENGEEIFVHFRSIRGEGRRGLRDGQSVSFVVADSEKGPQADDVVGED